MSAEAQPGLAPNLLDARLGPLRRLYDSEPPPGFPADLRIAVAEIGDSRAFGPSASDAAGVGWTWFDAGAARAAAVGEAVERSFGQQVPADLRRASYEELRRLGEDALDPARLALYSEDQYRSALCPFVPFRRDLRVFWTRGRRLGSGTAAWLPASLVWTTFFEVAPGEPRTHGTPFSGIAAGRTPAEAERAALLELCERDAVEMGWASGEPLVRLVSPPLEALCAGPEGRFEAAHYAFPSALDLPVVGTLVRDRETRRVAFGSACRPSWIAAARKAAAEGFQLLAVAASLDDPESPAMRRAPHLGLKPWRADRAYRGAYREDLADAGDLLCHLQLYLDPQMAEPLAARLAGGATIALADAPSPNLSELEGRIAALDRWSVDLTSAPLAAAGVALARVIVPGWVGNAPAAWPYLGGERRARRGFEVRLPPPYA